MKRGRLHALWGAAVAFMLLGIMWLMHLGSNLSQDLQQNRSDIIASQQELENLSRLSAALDKLDRLTIDEKSATRLEIMRHLGLEKTDYAITIGNKNSHMIAGVPLGERQISIVANLSYTDALALADRIYNNGKMNVTGVLLNAAAEAGSEVQVTINGTLYGLEKKDDQQ